ncbi:MAG TPA: SAM-dependent methyltransferase [Streptosporangiaceae bacterium]
MPPEVDTKRANIARVYDYLVGGSHNFLADQDLGRAIAMVEPNVRVIAHANRAFLGRAVRFLAASGIEQFLDIGSGIPTQGNVHEVAQQANPAARVVYVDMDPVAVAHSKAILAGNANAAVIQADVRDLEKLLGDPAIQRLIDFGQPVGLLMVALLHCLSDADGPWRIVAALRDRLPPGSYLVISHATNESNPGLAQATEKIYHRSVPAEGRIRPRAEILRFFDGFDLADPGLVYVPLWRPDPGDDIPADPSKFWLLVGVGQKS